VHCHTATEEEDHQRIGLAGKESGKRNADSRIQVQLEKDEGGSIEQS